MSDASPPSAPPPWPEEPGPRRKAFPRKLVGCTVLAAGALFGLWLSRRPGADRNLIWLLVLVWLIAGLSQVFVRTLLPACLLSGIGSAVAYVVLVAGFASDEINEMFVSGIIEIGILGFGLAALLGLPAEIHRLVHERRPEEPEPADGGERSDRRTCVSCGRVFQSKDYLEEPAPRRYVCSACDAGSQTS